MARLRISQIDRALIRLVKTAENAHQCAFTGPIFPQQGVDFAFANLKIYLVIGDDAGEPLGNAPHRHSQWVVRLHHFPSLVNRTSSSMRDLQNRATGFRWAMSCPGKKIGG
jgi:hypothetical protein